MGNVPMHSRLIRRLTKNSSGTVSVSIPLEHAMALGWEKGKHVSIERDKEKLIVRPVDSKWQKVGKQ